MKPSKATILLILAFLLLAAACSSSPPVGSPDTASQNLPAAIQKSLPTVSRQPVPWKSDGIISENEYTNIQKIGEINVFTRLEGDSVIIGLTAETNGYLALGIDPEDMMKGADMIFCTFQNGQALIYDMYSTGQFGPHPPDEQQGGTNDIIDPSGNSNGKTVTFEFKRKLNTGDTRDKILKIGQNNLIWAIGVSQDINARHSSRGNGTLVLQ